MVKITNSTETDLDEFLEKGNLGCEESEYEGSSLIDDDDDDEDGESSGSSEDVSQWTIRNKRCYIPSGKSREKLENGVYVIRHSDDIGIFFEKVDMKTQELVRFPDTKTEVVVDEIGKFWERQKRFEKFGFPYKRGILLWGPPGSGKSCTLRLVCADVIKRDGICIIFESINFFKHGLRILRLIQPETPVVVLMEDIESILESNDDSEILNLLDGIEDTYKVVFLATTNYPEELGARIVNRPSRFDKRFKIDHPNAECRKIYFEHLMREHKEELEKIIDLDKWVEDTEGFSLAHLQELFTAVVILEDEYEDAVKVLSKMKDNISGADDLRNSIGFDDDDD